jgi:succinyl-CoA synthetase beta subunit
LVRFHWKTDKKLLRRKESPNLWTFSYLFTISSLSFQVKEAFRIISEDKNVEAILVNVFGGIVDCRTIANGVVNALKSLDLKIPLVVRLEGMNVNEAKKILKDSGLKINRYKIWRSISDEILSLRSGLLRQIRPDRQQ